MTAERNGGLCMPCKQRANPPRFEVTPQDEERFRKNDQILRRLLEGCSEEEFTKLRCPACGSVLTLHVHPNLRAFAVRCSVSSLHLMRHHEISKPPRWWNSRVGDDWLDDVSPQSAGPTPIKPERSPIKPERSIEKKHPSRKFFLFRLNVLKTGTPT